MTTQLPVNVDLRGNVDLLPDGLDLGDLAEGRPPQTGETYSLFDRTGLALGTVSRDGVGGFVLVASGAAVGSVLLDRIDAYAPAVAAGDPTVPMDLLSAALQQLYGAHSELSPGDRLRFGGVIAAAQSRLAAPLAAAGAPVIGAAPGFPGPGPTPGGVLLSATGTLVRGGVKVGGTLLGGGTSVLPGSTAGLGVGTGTTGSTAVGVGSGTTAGTGSTVVGAGTAGAVGIFALAGLLFIGLGLALADALARGLSPTLVTLILRTLRQIQEALLRLIDKLLREKLRNEFKGLDPVDRLRAITAVEKCLAKAVMRIGRAAQDALIELGTNPLAKDVVSKLAQKVEKILQDLQDCLRNAGVNEGQASAIAKRILDVFVDLIVALLVALLPGAQDPIPPLGLQKPDPRQRDTHRKYPRLFPGQHRKGGFGYGEFPDDQAENPDISEEDPGEEVDPEDIYVDPETPLDKFDCAALRLRAAALRTLLERLRKLYEDLSKDYRKAARGRTPAQRDRALRLLVALDQLRREIEKVSEALKRTLIEARDRPCDGVSDDIQAELIEVSKLRDGILVDPSVPRPAKAVRPRRPGGIAEEATTPGRRRRER